MDFLRGASLDGKFIISVLILMGFEERDVVFYRTQCLICIVRLVDVLCLYDVVLIIFELLRGKGIHRLELLI
jgi:hypothetical protein